ncbi:MAG: rod-binding protein [Spirochaetes bacterium]|nr:rod-binding protein [Spirochaetota bacterium]
MDINLNSINNSMMHLDNSRLEQLRTSALSRVQTPGQGGNHVSAAIRTGNNFRPNNKELYDACLQFEALFIKKMLNSMRNTVERTSLSDSPTNTTSRDFFEDMLFDSYAQKMARTANLGIARMMYLQLYRSQQGM